MDTHWFTLYSDTFLWVKGDNGLIYSASNNQSRSFKIFNRVKRLCDELLILKNLYSISISEEDMNDSDVQQLVQFILEIKGGFLTPNTSTKKKPLSLKPVIKIHDEIDYYRWKDSKGFGGDIMQNLHELTFYINSSKNGNDFYYRQTIFPLQNCGYLDLGKILTFVRHSRKPYLTNINLVGNIF